MAALHPCPTPGCYGPWTRACLDCGGSVTWCDCGACNVEHPCPWTSHPVDLHLVAWNEAMASYEHARLAILRERDDAYYCQTEAGERMLLPKERRGLGRTKQAAITAEWRALRADMAALDARMAALRNQEETTP